MENDRRDSPLENGARPVQKGRAVSDSVVEVIRLLVTLATTAAGFLIGDRMVEWASADPDVSVVTGAMLGAGVGYILGGVMGRRIGYALAEAPKLVSHASGPELFAGAFGVGLGVFVGSVAAVPVVVLLPNLISWPLAMLLVLVLAAFGGRVFADRSHDLLSTVGLRPRDLLRPQRVGSDDEPAYIVDSSAAIDGRILELARASLIQGAVTVPEFVIDELQGIADAGDRNRRRRGRRGLDVLDSLRDVTGVDFTVLEEAVPELASVDGKLVALCERSAASLVTTDHNLAKAAEIRGVRVLNPHALGESLRPALVSGDQISLAIDREGSEPGQGVGFLDDGTMVVIEGGASHLGETVSVEVANAMRTSVGRLIFARLAP